MFDALVEAKSRLKPCRTCHWPTLPAKDTCAQLDQCFLGVNTFTSLFQLVVQTSRWFL